MAFIEERTGNVDRGIARHIELISLYKDDYARATNSKEKYQARRYLYTECFRIASRNFEKGDIAEAMKWFEESANYEAFAARDIAVMYTSGSYRYSGGIQKMKKDKALAKEWADKACLAATKDIELFGDDAELKRQLERTAKSICEYRQELFEKN